MMNRSHPKRPRPRWAAGLAVVLFLVGVSDAPAAAEVSEPIFYIETITVKTERLSPEIVRSESLLQEGAEYSEPELRQAVRRVNQLPFVLATEFTLNRGSERGRYELVIRVEETRRWFFNVDGTRLVGDGDYYSTFAGSHHVGSVVTVGDRDLLGTVRYRDPERSAFAGRRFALGGKGLAFAAFGSEDGGYAVGYQRYDAFGRGTVFDLVVGRDEPTGDGLFEDGTWRVRAQGAIPVGANQIARARVVWSRSDFDHDDRLGFGFSIVQKETGLSLAWLLNTLDDPALAAEGLYLVAEIGAARVESDERRQSVLGDGTIVLFERDFDGVNRWLATEARRYHRLNEETSVSAAARAFFEDGEQFDVFEIEAELGVQKYLVRQREQGRVARTALGK